MLGTDGLIHRHDTLLAADVIHDHDDVERTRPVEDQHEARCMPK
jgi:hypothetical protein